jgi:predicted N-acetyltransferase YhbS
MARNSPGENMIQRLTAEHSVENFDCGEPARNTWLCTRAFANQKTDDTVTYVSLDGTCVTGFHALTTGSIIRGTLPGAMRRNAPDPVSCVLLAQLAVDLQWQRKKLGRRLVLHAMGQAVKISALAGCRLFAVHPANPDLVKYYQKFEFTLVDGTTPLLMAMTLQKVRAILKAVGETMTNPL